MGIIEELRKVIEDYFSNSTFTSANPTHTNRVKEINYAYEPDLESLKEDVTPQEPAQPESSGFDVSSGAITSKVRAGIGGVTNPFGAIERFVPFAKLVPLIGTILSLPSIIKQIADLMFAPGGPADIRFRRQIQSEVMASVERPEKAKIRQGFTIVRITSSPTLRGEEGIGQTGQFGMTGIARYDQNFEAFSKLGEY